MAFPPSPKGKKPGVAVAIGIGPAPKGDKAPVDENPEAFGAEEDEAMEDPKSLAGTALLKALKGGDGAAVAAAFEELLAVLDEQDEAEPVDDAEIPTDDVDSDLI